MCKPGKMPAAELDCSQLPLRKSEPARLVVRTPRLFGQLPLGMVSDWGNGFLRKGLADDAIAMFRLRNFPSPRTSSQILTTHSPQKR